LPFVVTNGDVITDIDYGELIDFHVEQSAVATMAVRLQEWQNPFGVVKISDFDIYEYNEKPLVRSYINAGVYVLHDSSIQTLVEGVACDMPEIFQRLINNSEKVVAYPIHEGWLDVGRPIDFSEASKILSTIDGDGKG
jgi:NDP-sugar pyrophosphorylase family protein